MIKRPILLAFIPVLLATLLLLSGHPVEGIAPSGTQVIDHVIVWKGITFHVITASNSTIYDFAFKVQTRIYGDGEIDFNVTGPDGTFGFCNVTIPNELLDDNFTVLIDDTLAPFTMRWNTTHSILHFTYSHGTRKVEIIGTTVIGQPVRVYVSPDYPAAIPGETFTVDIDVARTYDLQGFEFKLDYNTTVLDATDLVLGWAVYSTVPDSTYYTVKEEINDTLGRIWLSLTFSEPFFFRGSGTLAAITFNATVEGSSVLYLHNTILYSSAAKPISHITGIGFFVCTRFLTTVSVNPSTITAAVGTAFTVNITVSNVTNLQSWQAGMAFNPNVLECLSYEEGPFLKQAGPTSMISATINNFAGKISPGSCSCIGMPRVNGSGTLATVTFKSKAYGTSELHLTSVLLVNSDFALIPLDIVDGYFEAYIDVTSPTVSITNPEPDAIIASTSVMVEWIGADNGTGIEYYSLYLNKELVTNTTGTSYGLLSLVEGLNNVTVVAYDKVGNSASDQISITVDLTPPTLSIAAPSDKSYLKDTVLINVTGNDANFDRMELYIGDILVATFNVSGTHTYAWNTTEYSDGTYKIALKTYDKAGHLTTAEITWGDGTVTVTVDNTPPGVSISSPEDATELTGTITIGFTASDKHLTNVLLCIDDSVIDVTGKTSYDWDTTSVGDGLHTLRILAIDEAGNTKQAQVTVTTINFQKAREEGYAAGRNFGIMIGVALGLIVGAIITFTITKKVHNKIFCSPFL